MQEFDRFMTPMTYGPINRRYRHPLLSPLTRLICCSLTFAACAAPHGEAQAAQFTLLGLGGVRQYAGFGYHYQGSMNSYESGKTTSTQHGFAESYSIGAGYSILHPRILFGDAEATFTADQEFNKRSSQGDYSTQDTGVSYKVTGTVLDRGPAPIHFNLNSSMLTVRPPFGRTYTVDSKHENIFLNLKNELLPAYLSLAKGHTSTSGLDTNIETSSRTFHIGVDHQQGDLSMTEASLALSSTRQELEGGSSEESRDATISIHNALTWKDQRDLSRRLDTRYTFRDKGGRVEGLQEGLGSTLDWRIGKALDGRLSYNKNRNEDVNAKSDLQSISGTLTQNFLRAIGVNLGGSVTKGSYDDGSDDTRSASAGVRYTNRLPKESNLTLSYSYSYTLLERMRQDFVVDVRDSISVTGVFPQFHLISRGDIIPESVRLYLDEARTAPYTDFTVLDSGTQTRLLLNSDPGLGRLYLSYSYRQSPQVKYSNVGQGVNGHLSMLGNRYVLSASYAWADQQILSGTDLSSTIGARSSLKLGAEGNFYPHYCSLAYTDEQAPRSRMKAVEANWNHTLSGQRGATLVTKAQDLYSWSASTGEGASTAWDNTLMVSSTYTRLMVLNTRGKLTLSYYNLLTEEVSSNKVGAQFALEGEYGKTTFTLDTAVNYGFSSSGNSLNQSLAFNVRRSF